MASSFDSAPPSPAAYRDAGVPLRGALGEGGHAARELGFKRVMTPRGGLLAWNTAERPRVRPEGRN